MISEELTKLRNTKAAIKLALVDKGQTPTDEFASYADNIRAIETGGGGDTWTDLHTSGNNVDIIMPSHITQTEYIFSYCNGLRSVTWNNASIIGAGCFLYSSLKRLNSNEDGVANIPLNVTTINTLAFSNCANIKKMDLSGNTNLKTIGTNCFLNSGIKEFKFPENLTAIPTFCIVAMQDLHYLRVPDSVTSIANYLYSNLGWNRDENGGKGIVWDFGNTRTTIPTLAGTSFIESGASDISTSASHTITKIVVPDALFDSWKLATNWSNAKFKNLYIKYTDYYGS